MENEPKLLDAMLKDQRKQKDLYRTGPYWERYCERIENAIKKSGVTNFRSNYGMSKGYGDIVLVADPSTQWSEGGWKSSFFKIIANNSFIKQYLLHPYLRLIQTYFNQMKDYRQLYYDCRYGNWLMAILDKFDLPDTLVGDCKEFIKMKGRSISISYISHLMRIYNFSQHIDFTKIRSVFEIGGGYGANAHLLLHLYPNIKKYVYLDIPPILYVGTQYLKHFYSSHIIDYLDTVNLEKISFSSDEEVEVLSICPWQIEKLDVKIDLFWNSASFQEIPRESILNYLNYISSFLSKSDQGYVSLVMYQTERRNNRIGTKSIITMFARYFEIGKMTPSIEMETTYDYFLGKKKGPMVA